ncbi:MAG: hypothetical protein JO359_01585 [Candidatus Eremiobacteraeota bacterium]|nr:hypothetical protein [Candidatus Eremiobacteraeota bacterium]
MNRQQAAADLAEVRRRLAGVQRFAGFSGVAAVGSGFIGLCAGAVQGIVAPHPHGEAALHAYLTIWLSTLAVALALNYGAVAMWLARNHGRHALEQSRIAAIAILPSILFGGALTVALVDAGMWRLLPGVWYGAYAVGLFASRTLVPGSVVTVAGAFGVGAIALLLPFSAFSLAWWVMPVGFGFAQIAIGVCLARDRAEAWL